MIAADHILSGLMWSTYCPNSGWLVSCGALVVPTLGLAPRGRLYRGWRACVWQRITSWLIGRTDRRTALHIYVSQIIMRSKKQAVHPSIMQSHSKESGVPRLWKYIPGEQYTYIFDKQTPTCLLRADYAQTRWGLPFFAPHSSFDISLWRGA